MNLGRLLGPKFRGQRRYLKQYERHTSIFEVREINAAGEHNETFLESCTTEINGEGVEVIAGKETFSGKQNNFTYTGKACLAWHPDLGEVNPENSVYAARGVGEHNYCRSADLDNAWCYTAINPGYWETNWEYCSCRKTPLKPTCTQ